MRSLVTVVLAPFKAIKFLFFLTLFSAPHGIVTRAIVGRRTANSLVWGKSKAYEIEQRIHEECPVCRGGVLRKEKDDDGVSVVCSECRYVLNADEERDWLEREPSPGAQSP